MNRQQIIRRGFEMAYRGQREFVTRDPWDIENTMDTVFDYFQDHISDTWEAWATACEVWGKGRDAYYNSQGSDALLSGKSRDLKFRLDQHLHRNSISYEIDLDDMP